MTYKLKTTKNDLYNKGFRYNKALSDDVSEYYTFRFPVHKYKKIPTLDCELTIELQTGKIITNVFCCGTNDIYAPYYSHEYGKYPILETINQVIETQLKKFGAKEINNE